MKWLRRTWISLIRNPLKSLLIFIVVFVMSNLLAGSLSIIQTSENIKDNLKKSISPQVTISYEKYYKKDKKNYTRSTNIDEMKQYLEITKELELEKSILSKEEHFSLEIFAEFSDLGWQENETRQFEIGLLGTNVIEPTYFVEDKHKLMDMFDNRFLNEQEIDSEEIYLIVDHKVGFVQALMDKSPTGLNEIGNEVTLTIKSDSTYYDESLDMNVPYEYKFKAKVAGVVYNKVKKPYENIAYISNKALIHLVDEANLYFDSIDAKKVTFELQSTTYSLDSIDAINEFENNNKNTINKLQEGFMFESASDLYERNIGPIGNLDTIAQVIFITAIIATIVILGLIVGFLISNRKKEMGIYMSLGEKRKNIIYQVTCEILLIATLAVGCASISGIYLGNYLSDYMLEVQRYVQRDQKLGVLANLPTLYKPIEDGITLQTRDDVIDHYEVQPTFEYFIVIYSVSELSIIVSCILPMMYLSSLKPKKIML